MSMFLKLIKLNLKVNFGLSALKSRYSTGKKKVLELLLIVFAIVVGGGSFISLYSVMFYNIFGAAKTLGQPEMVLTIAFVLSQMMVLIFGIFYIMSSFYFSKDIQILVPLPLRPYQVLGSKFVIVMVYEYLTVLPMLLPPVIVYGTGMGEGFFYWIKSIVLILVSPALPLVIASLFIVLIMRFVNLRKSKDLLAVIGGFFGIFLAVGINLFTSRIPSGNEADFFMNMLESRLGLVEMIGRRFPPSIWATLGMARGGVEGIGYTALYIIVSAVLFALLLFMSNIIFYKSLLAGQEATRKRKNINTEDINRKYSKTASPVQAVCRREWKLILRTPVYLINCLSGIIIGPIIVVMMLFTQGQDGQMQMLLSLMQDQSIKLQVTLGALGFVLFSAGMNMVASTSFSREGQTFWVSKLIPVSPKDQVLGKLRHSMEVSFIGIAVILLMLLFLFKMDIVSAAVILIISIIAAVPIQALSLLIDVSRPKLVWTNPQEAVKQNFNGLLGMLAGFLVIGILAVISVLLIYIKTPVWATYLLLAAASMAIAAGSVAWLLSAAEGSYKKIEM